MAAYFDDDRVNELLKELLERLYSLRVTGGGDYDSTLIFWGSNKRHPMLFARDGEPVSPQQNYSFTDLEVAMKRR